MAQQITWKNISIPSGSNSRYSSSQQHTASPLNPGLDALSQIFEDQQKMADKNRDVTIENNDMELQRQVSQIKDLGAFNQYQDEGQLDPTALQSQVGRWASPDAYQKALETHQGKLRTDTVNDATPFALNAAKNSQDFTEGETELVSRLRDKGMAEDQIAQNVNQFREQNAYLDNTFKKQIQEQTDAYAAETPAPKNMADKVRMIKEAKASDINLNTDQLNQLWTEGIKAAEYDKGVKQRDQLFNQAQADRQFKLDNRLTKTEELDAKKAGMQAMGQVEDLNLQYTDLVDTYKAQRSNALGMNAEQEAYLRDEFSKGKGVFDSFDKKLQDTFWQMIGNKQGDGAKKILRDKTHELSDKYGPVGAKIIVYQATQDAIENNLLSGQGLNTEVFNDVITKYKQQHDKVRAYTNRINEVEKEQTRVINQATRNAAIYGIDWVKGSVGKGNSTSMDPYSIQLPEGNLLDKHREELLAANQQAQATQDETQQRGAHKALAQINALSDDMDENTATEIAGEMVKLKGDFVNTDPYAALDTWKKAGGDTKDFYNMWLVPGGQTLKKLFFDDPLAAVKYVKESAVKAQKNSRETLPGYQGQNK